MYATTSRAKLIISCFALQYLKIQLFNSSAVS